MKKREHVMIWRRWFRRLMTVMLVASVSIPDGSSAHASTAPVPEVPDADFTSYCGIYCVYAAMNSCGHKFDFIDLLQTKYVGSRQGSSIQELEAAVKDHGMQALPMMGLSRANLAASKTPIVLHVSHPSMPGQFIHWVLFLGMEDGKARILDAPHAPELIPVADILSRWDGVGLYISEKPLSPWMLKLESLMTGENFALAASLLVISVLLQRTLRRKQPTIVARPVWIAVPAILSAAGAIAAVWHYASDDGYARNQVAVRMVVQQHRPSFLPKLKVPEMEKALQDSKVVIVDARFPRDYAAGHIPGAINIPVYSTQVERRELLRGLPRDSRVVVYCQSDGCQFDEALGSALVAEGIENVALFPGGWMQWNEQKPDKGSRKDDGEKKDESHE